MKDGRPPSSPEKEPAQTHCLNMGGAGSAVLRLTFHDGEIVGALEIPEGLKRKGRRFLNRWVRKITRRLDADGRGMRMVTTCGGNVVSVGVEKNGAVAVLSA